MKHSKHSAVETPKSWTLIHGKLISDMDLKQQGYAMTVNEILEQVKILSPQERRELIQRLLENQNATAPQEKLHTILEFRGIAAHLADDEDPQDYVKSAAQ